MPLLGALAVTVLLAVLASFPALSRAALFAQLALPFVLQKALLLCTWLWAAAVAAAAITATAATAAAATGAATPAARWALATQPPQ